MRWIAILYFVVLGLILLSVNTGTAFFLHWVHYVPLGDKTIHFFFLGGAAAVLNITLHCRTFSFFGLNLLLGSAVIFVLSTLEECSQMWLPNRTFSFSDLLANALGILVLGRLAHYGFSVWISSHSRIQAEKEEA